MSNARSILAVEGLKKVYHDGERELEILTNVNFTLKRGAALAIVGLFARVADFCFAVASGDCRSDDWRRRVESRRPAALSAAAGTGTWCEHGLPARSPPDPPGRRPGPV